MSMTSLYFGNDISSNVIYVG